MSSADEVNTTAYGIMILAMAVVGFIVNVTSIILLCFRKRGSMFHSLLKILAVYDIVVILGCAALYALPNHWPYFQLKIYPWLLPWLLPIVQIAMMTSVYCTVIMSFERYVRICHICQLRDSAYITEDNFKFYVLAFTLCPLIFYGPKFFEIRTERATHEYSVVLNCSDVLKNYNNTSNAIAVLPVAVRTTKDQEECLNQIEVAGGALASEVTINVTRSFQYNDIRPTKLRLNKLYYKIYCIGLNSIFASVIPLGSLFYLNICTIIALRKMKKQLGLSEEVQREHPLVVRDKRPSIFFRGSQSFRAHISTNTRPSASALRNRRTSSLEGLPEIIANGGGGQHNFPLALRLSTSATPTGLTLGVAAGANPGASLRSMRPYLRSKSEDHNLDCSNAKRENRLAPKFCHQCHFLTTNLKSEIVQEEDINYIEAIVESGQEEKEELVRDKGEDVIVPGQRRQTGCGDGNLESTTASEKCCYPSIITTSASPIDPATSPLTGNERSRRRSSSLLNFTTTEEAFLEDLDEEEEEEEEEEEDEDEELANSSNNTDSIIRRSKGILAKLDYIKENGYDCVWLSPFFEFGGIDMGNDVKNHVKVDPMFGSQEDLTELLQALQDKGLKVILEFIPNHTSNQHEWFQLSENRTGNYTDYYVWRDAGEENDWVAATGQSAWEWSEKRKQFYLHNYLPEMPDLNLENEHVREEMKSIFREYLSWPSVMGVHIGGFNLLFEGPYVNEIVWSDRNATMEFLEELHTVSKEFSAKDGLDRLFLIEMAEAENGGIWREEYRRLTAGIAVVPFSFGSIPFQLNFHGSLTGNLMFEDIQNYLKEAPLDSGWPCWEMNDHEIVKGLGRVPFNLNDLIFMTALLLPGTTVMYYGDEIGMANSTDISYDQTVDPYAQEPYCNSTAFENGDCYSRDLARTPMQWTADKNAGFTMAEEPWLPLALDYKEHNVVVENDTIETSHLGLFRKISEIRNLEAFKSGDVYFPYHDDNIFTFLRKAEDDTLAFMVILHLTGNDVDPIDFSQITPNFPKHGKIVATSEIVDHTVGSVLELDHVVIHKYEGFVVMIDFNLENDIEELEPDLFSRNL